MTVDYGRAATDYSRHRAGFPEELFSRLKAFGIGLSGQKLLDLGSGTGTLARGFAKQGCLVTALDHSPEMLQTAKQMATQEGVEIETIVSKVEQTGLPAQVFEVISAGQCWHWFDRTQAIREVKRVLKPGGRFVIAHFDWLPLPESVPELTEQMINPYHREVWNPGASLGHSVCIYPAWFSDVSQAGFKNIESFSFDQDIPYSHESWSGRVRASAGVAARLSDDQVQEFDSKFQLKLKEKFPGEPLLVPHRVFALVCSKPFEN